MEYDPNSSAFSAEAADSTPLLPQRYTTPILIAVAGVTWTYLLYSMYRRAPVTSGNDGSQVKLPWVGMPKGPFAQTRAHLWSFTNIRELIKEGYEKYNKYDKQYIVPEPLLPPSVVLPRSQIPWLIAQPDSVLSASEFHKDALVGDYSMSDRALLEDPYHEHVIHRNLARKIGGLIPAVWDEVSNAVDHVFAKGEEKDGWKEITVYQSVAAIIARVSNRVFMGLPLCRNEEYLSAMTAFAQSIVILTTLFRFIPGFLRPVVGPLITVSGHINFRRVFKFTLPLIQQRYKDMDADAEVPEDYITWHIRLARQENKVEELNVKRIARRLMPLNFAAIDTTTLTGTNLIFDVFSAPKRFQLVKAIREETRHALKIGKGGWTKEGLKTMVKTDSAIRESMRLYGFMTEGVVRKVIKEGGVTLPGGAVAKKGWWVGVDEYNIMHDPEIYSDPMEYQPYRFVQDIISEDGVMNGDANGEYKGHLKRENVDTTTTSDKFLLFSHGRHACPGRFLVSHELKMILSYIAMNYEVEPCKRPENQYIPSVLLPPMKATIKIRRIKAESRT